MRVTEEPDSHACAGKPPDEHPCGRAQAGKGSRVSIKPPSDLLLDVANAADPAKSSAAAERLARIAGNGGADDGGFTEVLDGVEQPPAVAPRPEPSFSASATKPDAGDGSSDAEVKAYRGIEALVFQSLVETMLPDGEEFFGTGFAASVWKSMLAEELGTALSKRIDLGIGPKHGAREARGHHPLAPDTSLAAIGAGGAKHT